jgi:hypothetical protein
MSRAGSCLFSPPIFPILAIVVDESSFVWRRCFLVSAMLILLRKGARGFLERRLGLL